MMMVVVGAMGLWYVPACRSYGLILELCNPAKQYNQKANMGNAWQSKLNSFIRGSPLAVVRLTLQQQGV